jgi:hypothetical protein
VAGHRSAAGGDDDRSQGAPRRQPADRDGFGGAGAEPSVGTPRWVKVFAIVAAAVTVLIVVRLLTGHGPGRHLHSGPGGHATRAGVGVGAGFAGHAP